jgi:hypothetical protein
MTAPNTVPHILSLIFARPDILRFFRLFVPPILLTKSAQKKEGVGRIFHNHMYKSPFGGRSPCVNIVKRERKERKKKLSSHVPSGAALPPAASRHVVGRERNFTVHEKKRTKLLLRVRRSVIPNGRPVLSAFYGD